MHIHRLRHGGQHLVFHSLRSKLYISAGVLGVSLVPVENNCLDDLELYSWYVAEHLIFFRYL